MASVATGAEDRSVSIGRVFSRAFGTIGSNPVATFGIAFLFGALPSALLGYAIQTFRDESLAILGSLGAIAVALASIVVGIVLATITQGAIVRTTIAYSEGRKASFAESVAAGLAVVLPLILMAILSGLGIFVGMIFLIVPGVILYIIWSVAAPALVEERLGAIDALGRSRELTRGARWKVFGLLMVLTVVSWMISAVIAMGSIAWYGSPIEFATAAAQGLPLAGLAINAVLQTFSLVMWGVIQASLYVELRNWKDGPATEKLADIFG
jgi:hypothetical protein